MTRLCCVVLVALILSSSVQAQRDRLPVGSQEVTGMVFLPDGKGLVTAQLTGKLRFFEGDTSKAEIAAHTGGVLTVAVAPDGKQVVSGGADNTIRFWDPATRKETRSLTGHQQAVSSLAFSPDSKRLASGGYDGTIRLWDLETGKTIKSWGGGAARVTALAFSPDGKQLASAGTRAMPIAGLAMATSDNARLWDLAEYKQLTAQETAGSTLAQSPDGRYVAVAGYQTDQVGPNEPAQIRINQVSLRPALRMSVYDRFAQREVFRADNAGGMVAMSPDGRFLVTGRGTELHTMNLTGIHFGIGNTNYKGVTLWETQTGLALQSISLTDAQPAVLAISPDGTRLAAGYKGGSVQFASLVPPGFDLAAARKADVQDLTKAWNNLASNEPAKVYYALWLLSAASENTLKVLTQHMAPVKVDTERIRKLAGDLDARRFAIRDKAMAELRNLGFEAEPELRRLQKAGKMNLEASKRVDELLGALDGKSPSPEALRPLRAIGVLERVRTPEAKQLLEKLAKGEPEARQTREAALTLQRLGK